MAEAPVAKAPSNLIFILPLASKSRPNIDVVLLNSEDGIEMSNEDEGTLFRIFPVLLLLVYIFDGIFPVYTPRCRNSRLI